MIQITKQPISAELVINKVKTKNSGGIISYVGLIRDNSQGKQVLSVEYEDTENTAENELMEVASEIKRKWPINNIAITHRIGKLKVGDINIVVAIAAAHRQEGFAACQYAIDQFKERLPTHKTETYTDGSTLIAGK
ncbi:MAG: molybdenum cofactor biosynthesis protein MoaE [Dehalococcoidales bacterium]|nr:molybdenum cofactor biosynthesis protein MoaE [Dehalococcoidales bacterium]